MARRLFGGSAADVAEDITGARIAYAVGTVWDGPGSSATRVTDLTDLQGAPLQEIQADAQGVVGRFYGPDEADLLWADFGTVRVSLIPPDVSSRLTDHVRATDPHAVRAWINDLKGQPSGFATLGADGTVPTTQLPANVTDGSSSSYELNAPVTIPLPWVLAVNGRRHRVYAKATGATRTATFAEGYRLTDAVTTREVSVPQNQVLIAEAQYSAIAESWVLTQVAITTGTGGATPPGEGGGGSAPSIDLGSTGSIEAGNTFSRTVNETENGSSIWMREWSIIDGPLGAGTVVGTAATLAWVPGSSPAGTTDIRQPVVQEMAFQINSTAENGTKDWTTAYDYIEDIGDDRGYTAGIVGFCSGTGDMLKLVQEYSAVKPNNPLAQYLPGLEECDNIGYGPNASEAAETHLGAAFMAAWEDAAANDPLFRKAQRDFRKRVYWEPALTRALEDGVGPLGLALHFDISINHGPGNDSESYGGIINAARASTSKPPADGGSEATYLTKLCDLRDAVLQDWGDYQADGRSSAFRSLISAGKLDLLGTINWSVYGDTYSFNHPDPVTDSRIGTYTLKYSATNAVGATSSNMLLNVISPEEDEVPGGGGDTTLIESLKDDFDDNAIDTTKWPNNYGIEAPIEGNGRARVPCGTVDYSGYESAHKYRLAGSSVFVRLYPPDKGVAVEEAYAQLSVSSSSAPEGTSISISANSATGKIRFNSDTNWWDTNAKSISYDPVDHAWVRIREASGTLYWDTSADGVNWTNQRSVATPTWVTAATDMYAGMGSHRDAGISNYAEFDNFNVAP